MNSKKLSQINNYTEIIFYFRVPVQLNIYVDHACEISPFTIETFEVISQTIICLSTKSEMKPHALKLIKSLEVVVTFFYFCYEEAGKHTFNISCIFYVGFYSG